MSYKGYSERNSGWNVIICLNTCEGGYWDTNVQKVI